MLTSEDFVKLYRLIGVLAFAGALVNLICIAARAL